MAVRDTTEIVVSAGGSTEPGLDLVAAAFLEATGNKVRITYRHDIKEPDVLVMPREELEKKFSFVGDVEEGAVSIGRTNSGLGVAVRSGAPIPDVSTPEKFEVALLGADRILLTEHSSSYYMISVFKKMGIFEQVSAKIERAPIAQLLLERLSNGQGNELMILSINAIRAYNDRRVALVGALPEALQYYPEFFAVPRSQSSKKEVAWAFARFCSGPAKHLLEANGFR